MDNNSSSLCVAPVASSRGTRRQVQQEWLAAQRTGFSAPGVVQ
ncbi:hypothetical protein [Nostoc sp.]